MLIHGDSKEVLKTYDDNTFDLIVTDPPYGISFMGKDWDKALPDKEVWKECFRVLKDGKFAFIMCSPRQDVLSRMIISLEDAGFRTNYTSIYWTYASGFPKAANVSKLIDKRNGRSPTIEFTQYLRSRLINGKTSSELNKLLQEKGLIAPKTSMHSHWFSDDKQPRLPRLEIYKVMKEYLELDNRFDELIEREEAEREIIGKYRQAITGFERGRKHTDVNITKPATPEAKKMEGAYVGFQPKPAVEVILVVSKGKSLTWLDDCRIPYQSEDDKKGWNIGFDDDDVHNRKGLFLDKKFPTGMINQKGRFPANLAIQDDVLQDYSRYFSLDSWSKTFPFLICPKASKSERNKGCEDLPEHKGGIGIRRNPNITGDETMFIRKNEVDGKSVSKYLKEKRKQKGYSIDYVCTVLGSTAYEHYERTDDSGHVLPQKQDYLKLKTLLDLDDRYDKQMTEFIEVPSYNFKPSLPRKNSHPTVKPLKLMSYLITLGSRENDLVLDPFVGSGTVCVAAQTLNRKYVGIEINEEYFKIAQARLSPYLEQTKIL